MSVGIRKTGTVKEYYYSGVSSMYVAYEGLQRDRWNYVAVTGRKRTLFYCKRANSITLRTLLIASTNFSVLVAYWIWLVFILAIFE